jgi:hypothetical protein
LVKKKLCFFAVVEISFLIKWLVLRAVWKAENHFLTSFPTSCFSLRDTSEIWGCECFVRFRVVIYSNISVRKPLGWKLIFVLKVLIRTITYFEFWRYTSNVESKDVLLTFYWQMMFGLLKALQMDTKFNVRGINFIV